ncbi:MAG: T9SS type A sorting domain-containing protein, partial [Flavobacteriaceae bacterium]|nr:T9SS type A sorting domain-containing protein [Flavobacteriaceae bacterium]
TVFSSILIGFVKGATDGYDRLYDAPFDINNTKLGLYSIVETTQSNAGPPPPPGMLIRTSIQGLPLLKKKGKKVSLGFVVDEAGMYTIKIDVEYIPMRYKIFLYDVKKNKIVNLRKKAYNFAIYKTGENNKRFKLYYTKSRKDIVVDIPIDKKATLSAYINADNNLIVALKNSTEIVKWIRLFTRNGRTIYKFLHTETFNVSRLKSGVYIVSALLNSNKKINTKIIISN